MTQLGCSDFRQCQNLNKIVWISEVAQKLNCLGMELLLERPKSDCSDFGCLLYSYLSLPAVEVKCVHTTHSQPIHLVLNFFELFSQLQIFISCRISPWKIIKIWTKTYFQCRIFHSSKFFSNCRKNLPFFY